MNYKKFTEDAYRIASEHGFHDTMHPMAHYLMLVVTEISECVEADRKGRYADVDKMEESLIACESDELWKQEFEKYIKDSMEDEMADIAIRIFDCAAAYGYVLEEVDYTELPHYPTDFDTFTERAFQLCDLMTEIYSARTMSLALQYLIEWAEWSDCNLEWHIEQKMKYNAMREKRHGKKY